MKSIALVRLGVVAILATATVVSAETQKKDVDIKAPDGVTLKGTYVSPGRSGPAMLLLHQCNMDRHAWDALANDLAAREPKKLRELQDLFWAEAAKYITIAPRVDFKERTLKATRPYSPISDPSDRESFSPRRRR